MGADMSSPTGNHGEIDGRPVTWFYQQPESDQEGRLSWAEGTVTSPNTQWTHLRADHIVTVFPSRSQREHEYRILYVVENETKDDDKKASPISFRTMTATSPPQQLVHDFQPAGGACLYTRMTRSEPEPNFHVIVSTGSGTGQALEVWEQLLRPFLEFVRDNSMEERYKLHLTESETTITYLTRNVFLPRANAGVGQSIVLLSGDGGLVDIANALLSEPHSEKYEKPNISILPIGTGNALAHSSGVTKDKTLGLSTLIRGSPKEIPLFQATFSPGARILANEACDELEVPIVNGTPTCHGAVVCSWGLHAGLVADSDTVHYRQFGAQRFQMAAKEALYPADGSPAHPYRGKVQFLRPGETEWQTVDHTEHAYILATLVSHLESGFHISPGSQSLDGKLRLIHFGAMTGDAVMEIMTSAYQDGKHIEDERVGYEEISGLLIIFDEEDPRWRRICVDGKIIRVEQHGWVMVKSGAGKGVVDLIAL